MTADNKTINPWLDYAAPQSESYPQIKWTTTSIKFKGNHVNVCSGSRWKYKDCAYMMWRVYVGYGIPPDDLKPFEGDIFVDRTPGPGPDLIVYWHDGSCWTPLNPFLPSSDDGQSDNVKLPRHPLISTKFLWGSANHGFFWFSSTSSIKFVRAVLEKNHEVENPDEVGAQVTLYGNVREMVRMVLERKGDLYEADNSAPSLARKEAEQRRRLNLQYEWSSTCSKPTLPMSCCRDSEDEEMADVQSSASSSTMCQMQICTQAADSSFSISQFSPKGRKALLSRQGHGDDYAKTIEELEDLRKEHDTVTRNMKRIIGQADEYEEILKDLREDNDQLLSDNKYLRGQLLQAEAERRDAETRYNDLAELLKFGLERVTSRSRT